MSFPTAGVKVWILAFEMPGIRGCSDTALDTMVVTSGSKPAAADMAKLVEPWQWTTAFTVSAPVSAATVRISAGWS